MLLLLPFFFSFYYIFCALLLQNQLEIYVFHRKKKYFSFMAMFVTKACKESTKKKKKSKERNLNLVHAIFNRTVLNNLWNFHSCFSLFFLLLLWNEGSSCFFELYGMFYGSHRMWVSKEKENERERKKSLYKNSREKSLSKHIVLYRVRKNK